MLHFALIFLVLGLIASILGFTTIAGVSITIAKVLAYVFFGIVALMLALFFGGAVLIALFGAKR